MMVEQACTLRIGATYFPTETDTWHLAGTD